MANTASKGQIGGVMAAAAAAATNPQGFGYTAQFNVTPPPIHQPQVSAQNMNAADQRVVDAQIAAVEARTDTKFAQVLGELKAVAASVTHLGTQMADIKGDIRDLKADVKSVEANSRNAKAVIITTIIGAVVGIIGLTYAAVSALQGAMGATATAYQNGMAAAEAKKPD